MQELTCARSVCARFPDIGCKIYRFYVAFLVYMFLFCSFFPAAIWSITACCIDLLRVMFLNLSNQHVSHQKNKKRRTLGLAHPHVVSALLLQFPRTRSVERSAGERERARKRRLFNGSELISRCYLLFLLPPGAGGSSTVIALSSTALPPCRSTQSSPQHHE